MRRILFYLTVIIFVYSCTDKGSIIIKGKLSDPKGEYVYLQELTVKGDGLVDSFLLEKSGVFKFKRPASYPSFYSLWVGRGGKNITLLVKPGDRVKIKAQADSFFYTYSITGSEESKDIQMLSQKLDRTIHTVDSLNKVFIQFKESNNPNIENIYSILRANYERCLDEHREYTINYIQKNPSSLASLFALYQKVNNNTFVLDEEADVKYMAKVDSALYRTYRDAPYVKQLHSNVELMKEQKKALELQKLLSIMGAKAPEIVLPSSKGDSARLSSIKNKAVLLYFWASWNKESRAEHPGLRELYNSYKAKGFEIFEVSLDKSREDWLNAIKEDGLTWINASDLKYWQSPVVKLYNFQKLPTSFLIDNEGVIISRDLKGEALKEKLAQILGEKSVNTASK